MWQITKAIYPFPQNEGSVSAKLRRSVIRLHWHLVCRLEPKSRLHVWTRLVRITILRLSAKNKTCFSDCHFCPKKTPDDNRPGTTYTPSLACVRSRALRPLARLTRLCDLLVYRKAARTSLTAHTSPCPPPPVLDRPPHRKVVHEPLNARAYHIHWKY